MTPAPPTDTAFVNSQAQLFAELRRVEHLVRAAVADLWSATAPERAHMHRPATGGMAASIEECINALLVETLLARTPSPERQRVHGHVDAMREEHAAAAAAGEARGASLRLSRLARHCELEPLDLDLLLLALLPVIERRFIDLFAYLGGYYRGSWLTLDLAQSLLDRDDHSHAQLRRRLAADMPLRRHDLLRIWTGHADEHRPPPQWQLQPDSRVASFLLGDDAPDERIASSVRLSQADRPPGDLFFPRDRFDALRDFLQSRPGQENRHGAVVHLCGPAGAGKETLAATLAAQSGRRLLVVGSGLLLQATPVLPSVLLREAMMQQAVLYWEGLDEWFSDRDPGLRQAMQRALANYHQSLLSSGEDAWRHHGPPGRKPIVEVAIPASDAAQLAACWRQATAPLKPIDPALDLEAFTATARLAPGAIAAASATAAALSWLLEPEKKFISRQMLLAASRQVSSGGLGGLAKRIQARPHWDDLVLPDARKGVLRDIGHHVRYRHKVMAQWGFERKLMLGRGISALFSGPPGTGKTMAAAVLATELGLDLYQVDLSQVVSKYIGETEKHLGRLFDAAEANSAILFFDEADALFGKRTEVRDAHDRYANMETSYLLQRIDEYEGLVVLATNLPRNMDDAFVRRLRFIVPFAAPDRDQRLAIWRRLLPPQAPCDDNIALERLADTVDLSGGYLRNIALSAAYLAAAEETALGMRHLVAATRREFAKVGRVLEADELEAALDSR